MYYDCGSYGYDPCCSYAYPMTYGNCRPLGGFALIVVLFILLIIIGACFVR